MNSANALIAFAFAVVSFFLLLGLLNFRQLRASRGNKLPLTKRYLRPPGESLRIRIEALDSKISDTIVWLLASPVLLAIGVYALLTDSLPVGAIIVALALAVMVCLALRLENQIKLTLEADAQGRRPQLRIWIPLARRTPLFVFGPDAAEPGEVDLEATFPSFDNEDELIAALDSVHKDFLAHYC